MELERETPLQEDNVADAELNPVYDRFVCLFLVNCSAILLLVIVHPKSAPASILSVKEIKFL